MDGHSQGPRAVDLTAFDRTAFEPTAFDARWLSQMTRGLVSVITPSFNSARHLSELYDGLCEQDSPHWEWIVSDDGSTRETIQTMRGIASGDRRVLFIENADNAGPFTRRNQAMARAKGEFIAFVDADDLIFPSKFRKQVKRMAADPDLGLCHHELLWVDEAGEPIRRLNVGARDYDGDVFLEMIERNGVSTSSVMVRREAIAAVGGFDEAFRYRGDWEMWTRIARKFAFSYIDESLGGYRTHSNNVSNNVEKTAPYSFAILDKYDQQYRGRKAKAAISAARANLYEALGMEYLVMRKYAKARDYLRQSLAHGKMSRHVLLAYAKTALYPLLRRQPPRDARALLGESDVHSRSPQT